MGASDCEQSLQGFDAAASSLVQIIDQKNLSIEQLLQHCTSFFKAYEEALKSLSALERLETIKQLSTLPVKQQTEQIEATFRKLTNKVDHVCKEVIATSTRTEHFHVKNVIFPNGIYEIAFMERTNNLDCYWYEFDAANKKLIYARTVIS